MKSKILFLLILVFGFAMPFCYDLAVMTMRGDYMFTSWAGITETNKSWFSVFFFAIVSGSLFYIGTKLVRKLRKNNYETRDS